jgi:UDP-N-acetylenolpyruvoylglucosamine reductase
MAGLEHMSTLKLSGEPLDEAQAGAINLAMRITDLHTDLRDMLAAGTVVRRDESMARRTTLRVGGPADLYVEPTTEADLATTLQFARVHSVPVFFLGRGSNLLIRDGGIRGLVICLCHPSFSRIEVEGEWVRCGAGAYLRQIANAARDGGLTGFEFLEGIPGSLGGALRMNAGAMGGWVFDRVETLRYMDQVGEVHEISGEEAGARYRGCPLLVKQIALGAVLKGKPAAREVISERMTASNQKRWSSQPKQPSAGCTFKNPAQDTPAGRLIDELGLKGTRVGDAMVSDVHANFFVNLGQATATDVLRLLDLVRQRVHEARGIELEPEVEIIGEDLNAS